MAKIKAKGKSKGPFKVTMRVSKKGDSPADVKAMFRHPMHSGMGKNKATGELIPAHYIKEVVAKQNGNVVFSADWSGTVAENPFIWFKLNELKPGDTVELSAVDTKGVADAASVTIKG